jgi:GNAT superfamily N-acetyltransferase
VSDLRIEPVVPVDGDAMLLDWQHIHNLIIPTDPLSLEEIRIRAQRNHLEVAYLGNVAVGCSTVRPPADDPATATVIARVLPGHRRQGFGEQIYVRGLVRARELGATVIETVVLASNVDGLQFAQRHGFVEIDRYVLPGDTVPYIDLRLA